jgi:MtN3 and saliva related transmembrane protein
MEAMLPTLIGFVAGCIGTYSFVPQVLKCWRTGETGAISLRMFAVRTFGALLWTFYGFVVGSLPVLIFSAVGLVLCSTILILKVRGSRSGSLEASKQLA